MISSQSFVIGWIEYVLAVAILLVVVKFVMDRLRQPADKINLVLMSFGASICIPVMASFLPVPQMHLGLFLAGRSAETNLSSSANEFPVNRFRDSGDVIPGKIHQPVATPYQNTDSTDETHLEIEIASTTQMSATQAPESTTQSLSPNVAGTSANPFDGWRFAALLILTVHGIAVGAFVVQWLLGYLTLRRITRCASIANEKIMARWTEITEKRGGEVRLLVSNQITAPLVYGWVRPTVLIPESVVANNGNTLRYCLAHEWAHIAGRDLRTWYVIGLCQYLLWYQPLFWLLRKELRVCQDILADNQATVGTSDHVEYSELLLSFARQGTNPACFGAIAFFDRSSQLSRRIKMLLTSNEVLRRRSSITFGWTSGCLLILASVAIGSIRLNAVQADSGKTALATSALAVPTTIDDRNLNQNQDNVQTTAGVDRKETLKVIRGKIVDEAGEPVGGASLWLPLNRIFSHTVQATSDDSGRFELTIPPEWISQRLIHILCTIWVHSPDHNITMQNVYQSIHGDSDEEYEITLTPLTSVRFRVLSPQGFSLPDVRVHPHGYKEKGFYNTERIPEEMQSMLSVRTNSQGIAELSGVHPEFLFRVQLDSDSLGRQSLIVENQISHGSVRVLRLREAGRIIGQLKGERSEWLGGVRLVFQTNGQGGVADGYAETVTNEDGDFEVSALASGRPVIIHVFLDESLPVRPQLSDHLSLMAGETMKLEIPLVPATLVRGTVKEKATGKPVPRAEITLRIQDSYQFESVTTDEAGRFTGRVLPGPLTAQAIYLPDHFQQLGSPSEETFQISAGVVEFALPDIEVVSSYEVKGKLIDEEDRPLADIEVSAISGNRRYGWGITDLEGSFTMFVPEGVEPEFSVFSRDRGPSPATMVEQDPLVIRYAPDSRERAMEAERAAKPDVVLKGRVTMGGKPVEGVTLTLQRGVLVFRHGTTEQPGVGYKDVTSTESGADGSYQFAGLKEGDKYSIEVEPSFPAGDPTWRHKLPWLVKVPENTGGEFELPDIQLIALTQSLAGQVVDFDGNPIAGARVSAQLRRGDVKSIQQSRTSGTPSWTKSDHEGRFQLKELPDEPLAVMGYIPSKKGGLIRYPIKLDVEKKNQQDIRIVLDPSLIEE